MSLSKVHAKEIREIAGAIYGLSIIVEDDGTRDVCDGKEAVLGRFHRGAINTAIMHLAHRAEDLAEAIEEQGGES